MAAAQMEGQSIVTSVVGPIGQSVADLQMLMKTLVNTRPWEQDPMLVPLPWRGGKHAEVQQRSKSTGLVFGVMWWDGAVMPHPPIRRAMEELVTKLKQGGHEVGEFETQLRLAQEFMMP